jgi:hypothetical protein
MAKKVPTHDRSILSTDEAASRGLNPLTVAQSLETPLPVGDGSRSMRYIEWLTAEQKRIMRSGDRRAEIVDEGEGRVALWVDCVVS